MDYDLYFITSEEVSAGRKSIEVVEEVLKAGVKAIQVREKTYEFLELLEFAKEVRELTSKYGAKLLINDRVDVALACNADGVHLGQSDMNILDAKRILPETMIIGVSARTMEEARIAVKNGADYIGVGPIFNTQSKKDLPKNPLGLESIKNIKQELDIPIVAIGGIKKENAKEVIKAGADCLSVISAISLAEDIYKESKEFRELILNLKG